MKKIIISGSLIVAVAALVTGATVAFFNDTETSSGNIFTAGSIDLTVDSFGHTYNGQFTSDGWEPTDLTNEKFFTLQDFKPADLFRRSISLHVESNDAWICIGAPNLDDQENVMTETEEDAGDVLLSDGELSENVDVLIWRDTNPNGVHNLGEPILVDSFFDVFVDKFWPVRDSTTGTGPLPPTIPIEMLQLSLCGGNHVINGITGAVTCDGSAMGDQAQTDSLTANLVIYGEQHRNNPNFKCADVDLNPPPR